MDQKLLEDMHGLLARQLLKRIKSGEATSADLSVARQFLKDNGIEVTNPKARTGPMASLASVVPFKDSDSATG